MKIPLAILATLSVVGGLVELPSFMGNLPFFSNFLHSSLPAASSLTMKSQQEPVLEFIAASVSVIATTEPRWCRNIPAIPVYVDKDS